MREIKFRAYDPINEVMEYNVNVNQGKPVKQGYQWFDISNTVYNSKLMQYTGLKDKYGTDIYEGDIVLIDNNWKDHVVYQQGCFMVDEDVLGAIHEFSEVIGNIYEDKRLLEGEE